MAKKSRHVCQILLSANKLNLLIKAADIADNNIFFLTSFLNFHVLVLKKHVIGSGEAFYFNMNSYVFITFFYIVLLPLIRCWHMSFLRTFLHTCLYDGEMFCYA